MGCRMGRDDRRAGREVNGDRKSAQEARAAAAVAAVVVRLMLMVPYATNRRFRPQLMPWL